MSRFGVTMLTIAAVLFMIHEVNSKRYPPTRLRGRGGCTAFGHSCFGGHGKRSGDTSMNEGLSSELTSHRQLGQEETAPHPGYSHSYNSLQLPGEDLIPIRDGGVYEHEDIGARDLMRMKLRNIVKHWMDNYRRSQLSNDDSFYADNL